MFEDSHLVTSNGERNCSGDTPVPWQLDSREETVRDIYRFCASVAALPEPILICGETGTGKDVVAREIHRVSGLPGEFVALNVGGLDDQLLSDTLFGHRKGAFTGAGEQRSGLVSEAAEGTLFLDEIGRSRGISTPAISKSCVLSPTAAFTLRARSRHRPLILRSLRRYSPATEEPEQTLHQSLPMGQSTSLPRSRACGTGSMP